MEKFLKNNVKMAKYVIRVICQMIDNYVWKEVDEDLLMRILDIYHRSIQPSTEDVVSYAPIQRGFEVLIRHMFENFANVYLITSIKIMLEWTFEDTVSDDALLDFGTLIEYAAMLHDTDNYRDSLPPEIFPLVLRMVASENLLHSLLGNRVLQHLLDRHNNRLQFDTPRIFFEDTHFNVEICEYDTNDKHFLRKYREMLHATILTAVQQHGMYRIHLENVYTSIALIVVEVPCGYTAAAVVCLAMAIQEYTLTDDSIELECAHRLHATVAAIMSLVCWVHDAKIFYEYLNSVISIRAQFAPHLNPPLLPVYQYAEHHILWNKPELFFEDWEARYGLWKCFRTRRKKQLTEVSQYDDDDDYYSY